MADDEDTMNTALISLATLREKVGKAAEDTKNVSKSIKTLQKDVRRFSCGTKNGNYIKKAQQHIVIIAETVVDNYDKLTSNDPLEIALGVIELIGSVGAVVAGPYGPLVASVCGLIASLLPLCGGKEGPSMSEVIDKVIREALDDFKDDEIYGRVVGSLREISAHIAQLNGVASHNGGILSDEEKSFLTTLDFSKVGTETLGVLEGQIEKHNSIKNYEKKSNRLAKYIYYYCMISVQKQAILTLQCTLLRANKMEGIFAGVSNYLYKVLPKEDRRVLNFLSDLPESKNWYMLYRHLHFSLQPAERSILTAYMKHIGCDPMEGQLCTIYNNSQNEYLYVSNVKYDNDRHHVFTWRPGGIRCQGLFRIVRDCSSCRIFGVYYGEYIYADDSQALFDSDRRCVFSWRSGHAIEQGDWEFLNSDDDGCFLRNIKQNEYL